MTYSCPSKPSSRNSSQITGSLRFAVKIVTVVVAHAACVNLLKSALRRDRKLHSIAIAFRFKLDAARHAI